MPTVAEITADLVAEQDDLERILAPLTADQWQLDTPSMGWTVADQVGHLGYFDRAAALAITDPEAFRAQADAMMQQAATGGIDVTLAEPRSLAPDGLLAWWRQGRARLVDAAGTLGEDDRLAWYGPDMSAKSFLTARLMEAWAHGQDVADALGAVREPSDRLRHVAQLGVITRGWSYVNRGREPDPTPVRVSLEAPSGETWTWGDDDAEQSVTGPAEDFCQVVTQRRHVDDTELVVHGAAAREWMELAQAFAGGPTDGRAAGTFPR